MKEERENTGLPVRCDGKSAYTIYLEESYDRLKEYLPELEPDRRKVCIVADSNVWELYGGQVEEILKDAFDTVISFVFPAGESSKTLDTVRALYEKLILAHFDRKDLLAALGGGVTGDLTGYAAATYLRGIDFIQLPTSLLAQVDSSIGGKTGVDFDSYKNMVGAFHQPKMVYMNLAALKTLSDEQFACGMGEILKHGLIRDAAYYEWCINNMSEIQERDLTVLRKMVEQSCRIKRAVVEKDPTEKGDRALLNFGHTLGHAIEKQMQFRMLHGQCIALGYLMAAHISWKRELISTEEFFEIRDMNVGFDLPISFSGLDPEEILAASRSDKKMEHGQIKFVLLKKIGKAFLDSTVTDEEMLAAIRYFRDEEAAYE
ncbi:MAG: 3-dehydroquinate synthase [Candidatus Limivivens sp.]|nr:3-dehydroquinate synthase [Candidatus Limivivens sp.]